MSTKALPCGRPLSQHDVIDDAKLAALEEQFKAYLNDKKLKWTRQRWAMAELILRTADHLDAQQIVDRVRQHDKHIGVATIYRNIKVMVDAGLIRMTHQDIEGRSRYEVCEKGQHDHMYCVDCGEIIEFRESKFKKLQENVAGGMNFSLVDHRLVLHGRCEYLKQRKRK
jgi:Fur family ferric uptake transcriptional regulator